MLNMKVLDLMLKLYVFIFIFRLSYLFRFDSPRILEYACADQIWAAGRPLYHNDVVRIQS